MLNSSYWQGRYEAKETGWDVGSISTPIKEYIDQLTDKSITILIPGCGNAHEAAYLWKKGFTNIYLLDYVAEPLDNFKKSYPDFPTDHLLNQDFFELKGKFDLIIEQTFFCALDRNLRPDYVAKMHSLLKDNGRLVGLLFSCEFEKAGPPFGGSTAEYSNLFAEYFDLKSLAPCYNSIPPRMGNELFLIGCPLPIKE
ncbi:MAG: methyltransferase domain-containing protein [Bacteroidota bacterium]